MIKIGNRVQYPMLLFIGISFINFSCYWEEKHNNESAYTEIIDNEMWNPRIIFTRTDKKMVEAKADKLYKQKDESAILVGNVEIDFYNNMGNHMSILYAESARINERNNNLSAEGNVYIVSDSGYTLTTNKIDWDNNYKMIVAKDSVMFTNTKGDTLYGIGFESDSDLEEWKIFNIFGIGRPGL